MQATELQVQGRKMQVQGEELEVQSGKMRCQEWRCEVLGEELEMQKAAASEAMRDDKCGHARQLPRVCEDGALPDGRATAPARLALHSRPAITRRR